MGGTATAEEEGASGSCASSIQSEIIDIPSISVLNIFFHPCLSGFFLARSLFDAKDEFLVSFVRVNQPQIKFTVYVVRET